MVVHFPHPSPPEAVGPIDRGSGGGEERGLVYVEIKCWEVYRAPFAGSEPLLKPYPLFPL
jgi:hypothetical protein